MARFKEGYYRRYSTRSLAWLSCLLVRFYRRRPSARMRLSTLDSRLSTQEHWGDYSIVGTRTYQCLLIYWRLTLSLSKSIGRVDRGGQPDANVHAPNIIPYTKQYIILLILLMVELLLLFLSLPKK